MEWGDFKNVGPANGGINRLFDQLRHIMKDTGKNSISPTMQFIYVQILHAPLGNAILSIRLWCFATKRASGKVMFRHQFKGEW